MTKPTVAELAEKQAATDAKLDAILAALSQQQAPAVTPPAAPTPAPQAAAPVQSGVMSLGKGATLIATEEPGVYVIRVDTRGEGWKSTAGKAWMTVQANSGILTDANGVPGNLQVQFYVPIKRLAKRGLI